MNSVKISKYYEKPCKFKLKSGKEIFGVIWQEASSSIAHHYFTSSYEFFQRKKTALNKLEIDINELVSAEYLEQEKLN